MPRVLRVLLALIAAAVVLFGSVKQTAISAVSTNPLPWGNTLILVKDGEAIDTGLSIWETYFTITKDCTIIYFAHNLNLGKDAVGAQPGIGKYDVATREVEYHQLATLPNNGVVFGLELSPDDQYLAMYYVIDNSISIEAMTVNPYGEPQLVFGIVGSGTLDFRWVGDHSVAFETVFDDEKLYMVNELGEGRTQRKSTPEEWETFQTSRLIEAPAPYTSAYQEISGHRIYSISGGDMVLQKTAVCASAKRI